MSYWTITLNNIAENTILCSGSKYLFLYNNLYIAWDYNENVSENTYDTYIYKNLTEMSSTENEIQIKNELGLLLQKIPSSSTVISLQIKWLEVPDGYNFVDDDLILILSTDGNNINKISGSDNNWNYSLTSPYNISITGLCFAGGALPFS